LCIKIPFSEENGSTMCYKLQNSFKTPSKTYKIKNKEYLCSAIVKRGVCFTVATKLDSPFYKYHWVTFDVNHAPPKKEKRYLK